MTGIPRRIVAYMLLMTAFKLRNPVKALVQVITNDFS
jgi:hypothetical protein